MELLEGWSFSAFCVAPVEVPCSPSSPSEVGKGQRYLSWPCSHTPCHWPDPLLRGFLRTRTCVTLYLVTLSFVT